MAASCRIVSGFCLWAGFWWSMTFYRAGQLRKAVSACPADSARYTSVCEILFGTSRITMLWKRPSFLLGTAWLFAIRRRKLKENKQHGNRKEETAGAACAGRGFGKTENRGAIRRGRGLYRRGGLRSAGKGKKLYCGGYGGGHCVCTCAWCKSLYYRKYFCA